MQNLPENHYVFKFQYHSNNWSVHLWVRCDTELIVAKLAAFNWDSVQH